MNPPKAFCPQCKKHVLFDKIGNRRRCPDCGFEYQLSDTRPNTGDGAMETAVSVLGVLGKVALIMLAIVIVGVGVLFAGCAILLSGSGHH